MRRWLPPVLLLGIVGLGLLFLLQRSGGPARRSGEVPDSASPVASPVPATAPDAKPNDHSPGPASDPAPGSVEANAAAAAPGAVGNAGTLPMKVYEPEFTNCAPATVLENMRLAFHSYTSMFNGNPIGTNPEITAALNGDNPKQAKFIREEDGLRINAKGELVDPWGTPYFFHQLSAKEMEIHCAGPDKEMWTADDLVIK